MKQNNYTFRKFDNYEQAWVLITVEAPDIRMAYAKAVLETNGVQDILRLVNASTKQVWEAAIISEEAGIERIFVQGYSHDEATLAAEAYMAQWYSGPAELFYVIEELEEVK